jgi:hypothetical protein
LTSQVEFSGAPTPTLTYQWKVCTSASDVTSCTDISGATSASYVPSIDQQGRYIVVAVTARNTLGSNTVTSDPTLVINPEIILAAPISGLSGTAGSSFILSVAAAGGVGAFGYTVASGSLPSGVSLDPASGQLSGAPSSAGTYAFTVRATDSNGVYKDVSVTITIAAAPVTTPPNSGGSSSAPAPTPTPAPTAVRASLAA